MEVHNQHLIDEESAALVMASLSGGKRKMEDNPDAAAGAGVPKAARGTADGDGVAVAEEQGQPPAPAVNGEAESSHPEPQEPLPDSSQQGTGGVLQPYPFFYYVDYSTEADPDPLTPLVPPGRVPNFPSKMHAILARQDLKDLITWLPHGRAWVVSNSKEFEKRVLPVYFEHQKYSSFVRQANGWGFRRITAGDDRNAYYHPRFLRGLPHLCKDMKRPGVNKKVAADPEHEPDLARISELQPLPTNAAPDDSILLHCTVQNGPKARMPIYSGSLLTSSYTNTSQQQQQPNNKMFSATTATSAAPPLAPSDHEFLHSFQSSLGASEQQLSGTHQHHKGSSSGAAAATAQNGTNSSSIATNANNNQQHQPLPMSSLFPMFPTEMMPQAAAASQQPQQKQPSQTAPPAPVPKISSLSAANQLAFANATAQFAAGFAAAMGMFAPQAAPPAGTENPLAVAGGMAAAMSTMGAPGAASLGGAVPPAAPKIAPTNEPKQPPGSWQPS